MARFLFSKRIAIEQYNKLRALGLSIAYSVKTNPAFVEGLEQETEMEFTVHNIRNLSLIKEPSRVWFFPQAWKSKEIDVLISKGVNKFVLDNENDLKVLLGFLKTHAVKISLLLRMKLREHTIFTGRYFVFGMAFETVNEWIPKLRKLPAIEKLGVHFHRKSQNVSEWRLADELKTSLTKETFDAIDIIDIGGGFPADYKNTSDAIMVRVEQDIKELKAWAKGKSIIAEPGRFISAPAGKLEVEIINVYEHNIIVDTSVYSGAMDTLVVPIKLRLEGELEKGQAYTIKGISACSMDIFRYKVFLKQPKVGDKLVFLNAGAYNYYTDFCNIEKPEVVFVD